jgi:hypothetical protein
MALMSLYDKKKEKIVFCFGNTILTIFSMIQYDYTNTHKWTNDVTLLPKFLLDLCLPLMHSTNVPYIKPQRV